ncbi:pineapple eye [Carabus blaptoides fortunei]
MLMSVASVLAIIKDLNMEHKVTCCLCNTNLKDPLNLGEMQTFEYFSAHYYCLLLSTTILQSGDDNEGILGFMPKDIMDELSRAKKRLCCYCHKIGATVLCETKGCRIKFHLPCGIQNHSGHQFFGRFISHCVNHRPRQKLIRSPDPQDCPICYESVDFNHWTEVINSPCCKKFVFHKVCVQKMALNAGYFCKCPICNNTKVFHKTMKLFGVFIPDRDASWETEPNAFEELQYVHSECNAEKCVCRRGRKYVGQGRWKLVLCTTCGSQGTHVQCSWLHENDNWSCSLCHITSTTAQSSNTNTNSTPSTSKETQRSAAPCTVTSNTTSITVSIPQPTRVAAQATATSVQPTQIPGNQTHPANKVVCSTINLDSEDDEVLVLDNDDVPAAPKRMKIDEMNVSEMFNEKPQITGEKNEKLFVITNVRSLRYVETKREQKINDIVNGRIQEHSCKDGTWAHASFLGYRNDSRSDQEFDTQQNAQSDYKEIIIID